MGERDKKVMTVLNDDRMAQVMVLTVMDDNHKMKVVPIRMGRCLKKMCRYRMRMKLYQETINIMMTVWTDEDWTGPGSY